MTTRSAWSLDRTQAISSAGMVAAKTPQAAEAGIEVLRAGGNAVDAAVAIGLAAGVVEPWMCGLGGGGFMVRHDSKNGQTDVVAFPMVAPGGATEDMYTLTGGTDSSFFGWPNVAGQDNILGSRSVCVPGTVAGLDLALKTFGSISFETAAESAISYAENGYPVTWHTSMEIARDLANLRRFPESERTFCPGGIVPWSITAEDPTLLRQPDLAETLKRVASDGPGAFYEGEIAEKIVDHLTAQGSPMSIDDFRSYEARIESPLQVRYGNRTLSTNNYGSGGITLAQSVGLLDRLALGQFGHNDPESIHLMSEAFSSAFADRFTYLADPEFVDVPFDALMSSDYLDERAERIDPDQASPARAGDRSALGVKHSLGVSIPDYTSSGSTTHMSVIDGDGVAVSFTLTLLNLWGSRVMVPGTGVLLNDGMMWFDPEPGKPNSIAGGKKPLSNMSPAILHGDDGSVAALGASGGRRIMNCAAQLTKNLVDHNMSMQVAVSAPRIDRSTPQLFVSSRIPTSTVDALASLGHDIIVKDETLFFGDFSSPACVAVDDGDYRGGVDPFYYPASAMGLAST